MPQTCRVKEGISSGTYLTSAVVCDVEHSYKMSELECADGVWSGETDHALVGAIVRGCLGGGGGRCLL